MTWTFRGIVLRHIGGGTSVYRKAGAPRRGPGAGGVGRALAPARAPALRVTPYPEPGPCPQTTERKLVAAAAGRSAALRRGAPPLKLLRRRWTNAKPAQHHPGSPPLARAARRSLRAAPPSPPSVGGVARLSLLAPGEGGGRGRDAARPTGTALGGGGGDGLATRFVAPPLVSTHGATVTTVARRTRR